MKAILLNAAIAVVMAFFMLWLRHLLFSSGKKREDDARREAITHVVFGQSARSRWDILLRG